MNILLALDSSPASEAVLTEVLARPWPEGAIFCVLHVIDRAIYTGSWARTEPFASAQSDAARSLVKSASDRLSSTSARFGFLGFALALNKGLHVCTEVVEGQPKTAIVEYAEKWGADFVILGSHGHSGVARFLLGSVSKAVVRHAPCSVEIVRSAFEPQARSGGRGMKLLLATDGSEYSEAAARSLVARPWPQGSKVLVLSVAQAMVPAVEPGYVDQEFLERFRKEEVERAQEAVASAERMMRQSGLELATGVREGNPKTVILDEAKSWGANLMVVGSHGRRGLERFLLGSVSEAVAMHAHCSVEVIRERISSQPKQPDGSTAE